MTRQAPTILSSFAKYYPVPEDNALCSGSDGVYDVSFFAASVRHDIEKSRKVFGRLSGRLLSECADDWNSLSEDERQAYLLESHEFAHHALMFSTPAGVLNWRINQVISRDVQWLIQKCSDYGIEFPARATPQQVLSSRTWQIAFKSRADVDRATKHEVLRTIPSLEDLILLRRILFTSGASAEFSELTFGDMLGLMKRTYAYLEDRCEVKFCKDWSTKLSWKTKVFPDGKAFNLVDIAEVHAIGMELFVLRAVGDTDGLRRRIERATKGIYGAAVKLAVAATSEVNDLGFSPYQMQLLSLISLSGPLDISGPTKKTLYLEDALPWWRFASGDSFKAKMYADALEGCLAIATQPLIGEGSRWLSLRPGGWPLSGALTTGEIGDLVMSLTSLGLDRQIHAIHGGSKLNWRFLATMMEQSFEDHILEDSDRLSAEEWLSELHTSVLLVEYKDSFHFRSADYNELYPPGSFPRLSMKSLDRYGEPAFQLIGQLLNGAIPRIMFAGYTGRALTRVEMIEPKLAAYFDDPDLAASTVTMLKTFLEEKATIVAPYLTFVPTSVCPDRFI